ncbi:uncharacterized protein M6B38_367280 [Iris pallida]|uniref:Endonuclease/exonuclease/phosphatase domain-containing protein n=1 Tax=Iris pallida TaxID=29817 RepID=A0AAX6GGG3_IRIPA|nr:uncharacterized protein M6B38_367280 [Iris pallida]
MSSTTSMNIGRTSFVHGLTRTMSDLFSPPKPRPPAASCSRRPASMLRAACRRLRCLCSGLRRALLHRPRRAESSVTIRCFRAPKAKARDVPEVTGAAPPTIRLATFNAAMFSMAPAVNPAADLGDRRPTRGILRRQQQLSASKRRVSINLPEDEITVTRQQPNGGFKGKGKASAVAHGFVNGYGRSERSVLDVLREAGADIIAVQNVKAEEEKAMRPLSDLADGLGMKFVFAESWAPEYGNAILSRWPIKHWKVHKICDHTDFRNVLKATIDIPRAGEVNFNCTYLDHLDENWRMKQISTILRSSDGPHIIAGGLNSLDGTDYSAERWNDIVKYYEEIGKPTPKVEVMKFLKGKQYSDAKDFAGECESVVVVAKGQDVQGTCKYGTRVDYILASPNSPYRFVPGSYGVVSSKGTSDHHIVKVDIVISKIETETKQQQRRRRRQPKQRVVKIDKGTSKGIWRYK